MMKGLSRILYLNILLILAFIIILLVFRDIILRYLPINSLNVTVTINAFLFSLFLFNYLKYGEIRDFVREKEIKPTVVAFLLFIFITFSFYIKLLFLYREGYYNFANIIPGVQEGYGLIIGSLCIGLFQRKHHYLSLLFIASLGLIDLLPNGIIYNQGHKALFQSPWSLISGIISIFLAVYMFGFIGWVIRKIFENVCKFVGLCKEKQ